MSRSAWISQDFVTSHVLWLPRHFCHQVNWPWWIIFLFLGIWSEVKWKWSEIHVYSQWFRLIISHSLNWIGWINIRKLFWIILIYYNKDWYFLFIKIFLCIIDINLLRFFCLFDEAGSDLDKFESQLKTISWWKCIQ